MAVKKWAVVTGASSGIGYAISLKLVAGGWNILGLARNMDKLQLLKTQARELNPEAQVLTYSLDVRDVEKTQLVISDFESQLPADETIDVLINNAGLALGTSKVSEANPEDWEVMLQTNVMSLMRMTRLILPLMLKNHSGHIVNIGSVAGRWVYPGGAVYCATKHAVRAFSEGLRLDLLGSGIRVSDIEPGMVETNFSQVRFNDPIKAKAVYQGMTPLSASDIAETVFWCLSQPKHVNIQELVIYPTDQAGIRDVMRRG